METDGRPSVPPPFFRQGADELGFGIGPDVPGLRPPSLRRPASDPDDTVVPPHATGGSAAEAPPESTPKSLTRAETIDRLLGRLAKSDDASESKGIAGLIEQLWMKSGSETADLLMGRAVAAMNGERHDVASAILDQIITLQPGWAEAWNKRATLRFLDHDDLGSMGDISHVLALEPRHFGALSGMGFILERNGNHSAALTALRRALAVYPKDEDLRKTVDKLTPTVEGQDL